MPWMTAGAVPHADAPAAKGAPAQGAAAEAEAALAITGLVTEGLEVKHQRQTRDRGSPEELLACTRRAHGINHPPTCCMRARRHGVGSVACGL